MNDHLIRLICEAGQPDIVLKHHHLNYREREKRKKEIRDFISRSFNWAGQPMPTGEEVTSIDWNIFSGEIFPQVRQRISSLPSVELPLSTTTAPDPLTMHYTERVQSFFPICKIASSHWRWPSHHDQHNPTQNVSISYWYEFFTNSTFQLRRY